MECAGVYRLRERTMKFIFPSLCVALLFFGCTSVTAPVSLIPSPTAINPPVNETIAPSPTDLPLALDTETSSEDYCKPPYAVLPVSDGNDISEDEIVHELMQAWLRRYANSDAPLACRIEAFTIDKVYFDLDILSRPLEPRGNFMRLVDFSVKPIQISDAWMSFPGELDQENWLHISHAVAVFETAEGYTLQFAYP